MEATALFAAPAHLDEDGEQLDSDGEQEDDHTSVCNLEDRGVSQLTSDMDDADVEDTIVVSSADLHSIEHN